MPFRHVSKKNRCVYISTKKYFYVSTGPFLSVRDCMILTDEIFSLQSARKPCSFPLLGPCDLSFLLDFLP